MAVTTKELTKDTWEKIFTNVKYEGQAFVLDMPVEPTAYLVTFVDTGAAAPAADFDGGIPFTSSFSPSHEPTPPVTGSDFYVMAKGADGKLAVIL